MKILAALILALSLSIPLTTGLAQTAAKKSAAKKSPAKQPAAKKTATKKPAPAKRRTASRRRTRAASWRNRQLKPEAARYKDIQQALVDKGFLKAEPNGVWGDDSVEALKRFQEAQHLTPTGKLNSLSLIALGLGPKREPVVEIAK
ncbi:MAG: peptidoglycan-binding domain-containing protein [Bryobacteraceae bacterium]